jgi:two-component system response regulator AdeR
MPGRAIQLGLNLKPDLVLLDIELPDMEGFTVAKQIKSMRNPPRIILLSMHYDVLSKKRGAETGCDAFVGKEFGWGVLLPVLRNVLESQ